jgi:hypothetical protein
VLVEKEGKRKVIHLRVMLFGVETLLFSQYRWRQSRVAKES